MPKVHFGKRGGAFVMKAGRKKYLSKLPPEVLNLVTANLPSREKARLSETSREFRDSAALGTARPDVLTGRSRDQELVTMRTVDLVDNYILDSIGQNILQPLNSINEAVLIIQSIYAYPLKVWAGGPVLPPRRQGESIENYEIRIIKGQYSRWIIGRGGSIQGIPGPWPLRPNFNTSELEQHRNQAIRDLLPSMARLYFGRH